MLFFKDRTFASVAADVMVMWLHFKYCLSIKNSITDITFSAFSLARRTQDISHYACTTKYAQ